MHSTCTCPCMLSQLGVHQSPWQCLHCNSRLLSAHTIHYLYSVTLPHYFKYEYVITSMTSVIYLQQ